MRRSGLVGVVAVVGLTAVVSFGGAARKPESPTAQRLEIGFIAPLSGSRASIGEDARIAAELAMEDLKATEGSTTSVSIRFQDSEGNPAKGVAAFQQLAQAGITVVITQNINVSLPISPLANRLHVLQLAITTTSDRFTTPKDFVFRTNGSTFGEARLMAKYLGERSKVDGGGVGIVVMQDEYPQMLYQHLISELEEKGVLVSSDEEFLPDETDFRTILGKLNSHRATQLVCLGYQVQCGLFVRQLRELGMRPESILVNTPVNNREFFTTAGAAAEGVLVTYPEPQLSSPAALKFIAKTGREMNFFSSNAYDAVQILAAASRRCKEAVTAKCMAEGLNNLGDFDGASGRKHFDENGDMQDTYRIMVARGGRFVEANP